MTSTNPGLALGIAAVAPTVTALIAILRAVLNTNSRRRKKVLANLDFVSRLRDYEAKDHVTLSPHVFDRAHAELARSTRLYVDRESWKWVLAYLLVYGSFINVLATFVSLLIQGMYWALRWQLPQDVLAPLKLSTTVSSVAILAVAAVVCLWFAFEVSWGESANEFEDRDNHLVPRPGTALTRPVGKPRSTLTRGEKKRMAQRLNRQRQLWRLRRRWRRNIWVRWCRLQKTRIRRWLRRWRRRRHLRRWLRRKEGVY